ncbi:signal peptidase II [Methylotenera oryzisoli]|nr:signal peptidase II [Methylotenera oryzisoli]
MKSKGNNQTLGCALGNVANRVVRGQVVDFLDFHRLHAH